MTNKQTFDSREIIETSKLHEKNSRNSCVRLFLSELIHCLGKIIPNNII